ncbi:YIP1 family protein [Defluviimonas sp. SAOS-178_SWC]|uniref:YIP1 family protein n=1 Tax=Defluviimonas sp. SAOS-178_SWC TaxID=3121287 RepID=UPI003221973E
MAITDDIVATYRGPGAVMRRLLAGERHEVRALAYLLAALIVAYIALWPALSRADVLAGPDGPVPMAQRMIAAFLGVLALLPVFYMIAALSRLAAGFLGGRGSFFSARIVLFWALLATTPMVLLRGLVAGFMGPGPQLSIVSVATFAVFLWFWFTGLRAAEFGGAA